LWDQALRQQIYLGDEAFIERMQIRAKPTRMTSGEILLRQRSKPRTLAYWLANSKTREDALRQAHLKSGMSMSAIAVELNLSVSRISRLIARAEARNQSGEI
jgi:DNA-directed RNA polymerase specialized sigma subunit